MTFMEAEAKLAEIADGRYYSLSYELTTYADGKKVTTVRVYIDGVGESGYCRTWEYAFTQLKGMSEELPGEVPEPVE